MMDAYYILYVSLISLVQNSAAKMISSTIYALVWDFCVDFYHFK